MPSVGFLWYLLRVPPQSEKVEPFFPLFSHPLSFSPTQTLSTGSPAKLCAGAISRAPPPRHKLSSIHHLTSCLIQPPPGPDVLPHPADNKGTMRRLLQSSPGASPKSRLLQLPSGARRAASSICQQEPDKSRRQDPFFKLRSSDISEVKHPHSNPYCLYEIFILIPVVGLLTWIGSWIVAIVV
jgi:hypothetical protein